MYASMNFLSKSQLRQAVQAGLPVILYSPIMGMPAVNNLERVEGPWPGTIPPVEEIPNPRDHGRPHPRRCVKPWHAEVLVQDMRIVAVVA